MKFLKIVHGRKTPPGLELEILRRLPRVTLIGSLIPVALSILVRVLPAGPGIDATKHIKSVDIFAIATGITFLTAVFTVAIGAVIVHIMKGPAYAADAYPVSHADRPRQQSSGNEGAWSHSEID